MSENVLVRGEECHCQEQDSSPVIARGPERSEGTPKQSHNPPLEKKEVKQKRFNSLEEMMDSLDTKHTYILRVIDHE